MKTIKYVGFIIFIIFILQYGFIIYKNIKEINKINLDNYKIFIIIFCILLYSLTNNIESIVWGILLKNKYINISWNNLQSISLISQIGKYMPGNICNHLGRLALSKKNNIPLEESIKATLLEIFYVIMIGVFISYNVIYEYINIEIILSVIIILFILTILVTVYYHIQIKKMILVVLLLFISYFIMSVVLYILIITLTNTKFLNILQIYSNYTATWIIGFLTIGAPAGFGVREIVFIELFSKILDYNDALTLSMIYRIVTVLGDGFSLLIGIKIRKKIQQK